VGSERGLRPHTREMVRAALAWSERNDDKGLQHELEGAPDWRWMFDPNVERDPAGFDVEAQWAATGRGVKEWRAGRALRMWRGHARMLATPADDAQRGAYERAIAFGLAPGCRGSTPSTG